MTKRSTYDVLDLQQGSDEWKEKRYAVVTASQMSVLFGVDPYQKQWDLLAEKVNKKEKPVSDFTSVLYERGHKAEVVCREHIESEYGVKFPPMVLVSRKLPDLMASLDGFNEEKKIIFEAKYLGKKALDDVAMGIIKPHHKVQVQAQLFVSGAERCIYFCLDDDGRAAFIDIWPDKVYQRLIPAYVEIFMMGLKIKRDKLNETIRTSE